MRRESELCQWLAHVRFQLRAQGLAVERRRMRIFLHGLALHEQPLAGMDGVERGGLSRQSQGFRLDAEQRSEEAIQMRPQRHHQLAFGLLLHRVRGGPRFQQPGVQAWGIAREAFQERAVEPDQPVPVREIGEAEAEAERRRGGGAHRIQS